jgi:hypothetical protein
MLPAWFLTAKAALLLLLLLLLMPILMLWLLRSCRCCRRHCHFGSSGLTCSTATAIVSAQSLLLAAC